MQAVKAVAYELTPPVLVHSDAGKDRTGLVVALAQLGSGVPWAQVANEYEAAALHRPPAVKALLESCPLDHRDLLDVALSTSANVLHAALTRSIDASRGNNDAGRTVVLCGLPGSGKTTVALQLCRENGWVHVSSDAIASMLPPGGRSVDETFAEARKLLPEFLLLLGRLGGTVVVDASLPALSTWTELSAIAALRGSDFVVVELVVSCDVAAERISQRPSQIAIHTTHSLRELSVLLDGVYEGAAPDRLRVSTDAVLASAAAQSVLDLVKREDKP